MTVTAEMPLVDKTNTSDTTKVSSPLTEKLAVGRGYQNLIAFAPGVTNNSGGNPNSTGRSSNNLYLFDGVDTTDVTTGTFGQNFNFEAIQEVNVSTTGISAEYGRSQGAFVNVVTKSGTNQVLRIDQDLLDQRQLERAEQGLQRDQRRVLCANQDGHDGSRLHLHVGRPVLAGPRLVLRDLRDPEAGPLGGPDAPVSPCIPNETGQSAVPRSNVRLWDGKLTGQVTPSQLLTVQFNSDPITGFIVDYWASARHRLGGAPGSDVAVAERLPRASAARSRCSWSGVFGSKVSAEAGYAEQDGNITVGPFRATGRPSSRSRTASTTTARRSTASSSRPRTQANLALSVYHELFGSRRQFKVGVDYQI